MGYRNMAMGVLASHTGVFRGARLSSLPTKKDGERAPLKTPTWEAMAGSRIWHHLSDGKFISCMNIEVSLSRILVQGCLVPGLKYGGKIAQELGFRVDKVNLSP